MGRHTVLLLIALLCPLHPNSAEAAPQPRSMRVGIPVADLRKEPRAPLPVRDHDLLEQTQLLYGERVEVLEEKEGWARVEAVEQLEWSENQRWQGYPGWVQQTALVPDNPRWVPNLMVTKKETDVLKGPGYESSFFMRLPMGSRLLATGRTNPSNELREIRLIDGRAGWVQVIGARPLEQLRKKAVEESPLLRTDLAATAQQFLGDPYYWGGRSAYQYDPQAPVPPHTGVDCSGLVGLVYQANGIQIPRDAHEQWMQAVPISPEQLSPGDLIFLHDPENPEKVTHVMLYIGKERIIEGPGTGKPVREISLKDRLREAKGRRISFGTYLP